MVVPLLAPTEQSLRHEVADQRLPLAAPVGPQPRGLAPIHDPQPLPATDVPAMPERGERGHVVRVEAGHRVLRGGPNPPPFAHELELHDVGSLDAVPHQGLADREGHRAEVLADQDRSRPPGLQTEDRVELLGPVPDVQAVGGLHARGDDVQPMQAEGVVDPKDARMPKQVPHHLDRISVALRPDALR